MYSKEQTWSFQTSQQDLSGTVAKLEWSCLGKSSQTLWKTLGELCRRWVLEIRWENLMSSTCWELMCIWFRTVSLLTCLYKDLAMNEISKYNLQDSNVCQLSFLRLFQEKTCCSSLNLFQVANKFQVWWSKTGRTSNLYRQRREHKEIPLDIHELNIAFCWHMK